MGALKTYSLGPPRPAEILLVEDDEGDALLTEKALRAGTVPFNLHLAETGQEALDFLAKAHPRPDLILLDLNLPGLHGKDVLREIKVHAEWRRIPVVVLTSSQAESDILSTYDLYCNAYMVKPGDPKIFESLTGSLEDYWFGQVELAPR
jgi:CheY-like chemotaxis protein